jgi:hypothetical protein
MIHRLRESAAAIGRFATRDAIVVVACLVILVLRRPDALIRPQLWAEDFFFLVDAELLGPDAILSPKYGYLHLLPRLIAGLAAPLHPFLIPAFFSAGATLVLVAVLRSCLSCRHDLPLKPLLALAVVLVPHSGEVFFNPTNVQWIAALGLALLAIKRDPSRPGEWAADVATVILAGLSGPFAILALPLFLWRAFRRRSRASLALVGAVAAVACVQLVIVLGSPPDREFVGPFSAVALAGNLAHRNVNSLFLGVLAPVAGGYAPAIGTGLAIGTLLLVALRRCAGCRENLLPLVTFALAVLASSAIRKRFDLWGFNDVASGDRYFLIPKVVLLWLTVVLAASCSGPWLRGALVALLVCSVAANAPRLRFQPYHDFGWYASACAMHAGEQVDVHINPGWTFRYTRFKGAYHPP